MRGIIANQTGFAVVCVLRSTKGSLFHVNAIVTATLVTASDSHLNKLHQFMDDVISCRSLTGAIVIHIGCANHTYTFTRRLCAIIRGSISGFDKHSTKCAGASKV